MTLTKEQRAAYGPGWDAVRKTILDRAGSRCECLGECGWTKHTAGAWAGRCPATHLQSSPITGSKVVLTIAHLDQNGHLGIHDEERLRAMCQGCHLSYDRNHLAEVGLTEKEQS